MHFTDIIYLDPSLVSEAYTEFAAVSPVTKIIKSQDLEGTIGAGIFHLGGTSRESHEFTVSTTQMFFVIEEKLRRLPLVTAREAISQRGLFWINGILAVGKRTLRSNEKVERELSLFTIANDEEDFDRYLDLAAKDEYFTSGYDRMAAEKEILGGEIWEPVEALIRPAFSNSKQRWYMFTPILILKK
ncbi:MAG TPA: hypothetical protein VFC28_12265 [Opitutaceae bacterium]|nr:hypothetical protein [Opitutaceae bacterium]